LAGDRLAGDRLAGDRLAGDRLEGDGLAGDAPRARSESEDPNTLLEVGGSTTAIILSIAFLILALAEYNKVFVPVMLQKVEEKQRLNNPLE
jgi:hypothetical protein